MRFVTYIAVRVFLFCGVLYPAADPRQAFLAAASTDRDKAVHMLAGVTAEPWIGETPFFDAVAVAWRAEALKLGGARGMILASARRYPDVAIRAVADYYELPYGGEALEQAILAAPDGAVPLATGSSDLGKFLSRKMRESRRPELRRLAALAASAADPIARRRAAALIGEMEAPRALAAAANTARYFRAVAALRSAPLRDRVLERESLTLTKAFQQNPAAAAVELKEFNPRDVYLLLAYGRAEEEDTFFAGIVDRLLLPKMRAAGLRPLALVDSAHGLRYRSFVAAALSFNRLEQFLALSPNEAERTEAVARFVRGIDAADHPLEEAVVAAEIAENTTSPERLRGLLEVAVKEQARTGDPIYSTLAASIGQRLTGTPAAGARPFDVAAAFDSRGVSVQRYYFYYDDDGAESFDVFRRTYASDASWKVKDRRGWVHIVSKPVNGRHIEIFANEPFDLLKGANAGKEDEAQRRQAAVAKAMSDAGLTARVVVHRGHAYHTPKTVDQISSAARLVFLGSCRGSGNVARVLENAPEAQVIATKGIGSHSVNDPVLKSLNDRLLRGAEELDWDLFWRDLRGRLGTNPLFADYIPPNRNPAVIFLRAYYAEKTGSR